MGKVFRNEGISPKHSPGVHDHRVHVRATPTTTTSRRSPKRCSATSRRRCSGARRSQRNGETIDLAKPWRRMTMREAILEGLAWTSPLRHTDALADADRGRAPTGASSAWLVHDWSTRDSSSPHPPPDDGLRPPADPAADASAGRAPERAEWFDADRRRDGVRRRGATKLNDPDAQRARFAEQHAQLRAVDEPAAAGRRIRAGTSVRNPAAGGTISVDRLLMILLGLRHAARGAAVPGAATARPLRASSRRAGGCTSCGLSRTGCPAIKKAVPLTITALVRSRTCAPGWPRGSRVRRRRASYHRFAERQADRRRADDGARPVDHRRRLDDVLAHAELLGLEPEREADELRQVQHRHREVVAADGLLRRAAAAGRGSGGTAGTARRGSRPRRPARRRGGGRPA